MQLKHKWTPLHEAIETYQRQYAQRNARQANTMAHSRNRKEQPKVEARHMQHK